MSIYRRKSGRYAVLIDLESGVTGARRRKSIGTYRTRKEAERAEREALAARDRGIDLSPKTVTVAELMTRYIAYCRADGRTAVTLESYEQKSKRYIEPRMGSLPLAKLRPAHIAEWKVWLQTKAGENEQPLSPKTVRNIYGVLHAAWRYALDLQLVSREVFVGAAKAPKAPRSSATAFTDAEMQKLIAAAEPTRWASFVLLALATGARRGELCALSWSDVDFEARTLTIARSLAQTKGRVEMKGTKTGNVRRLTLSPWAVDALRRQRALQAQDKLQAPAGTYMDEGAVFADERGQRVSPMAATKAFRKIALAAGIASTRLHDTRHTAASHLIAGGVDVRTTAAMLGHTSPTVTLSTYAHLIGDAQREAADLLGARLERIASESGPAEEAKTGSNSGPRQPNGNRGTETSPIRAGNLVEARRLELLTLTLPA